MALIVKDRVQETTSTVGTIALVLTGAVSGFQPLSAIGNGNTTYYCVVGGTEWEVGIGTYTLIGTILSRDTILSSSNGGSAVNFSSGVKNVFVTYPAGKSVTIDDVQTLTNKTLTSPTLTTPVLGTPASGTLTNCTGYTYANLSGTVPTWNQNTTGTASNVTGTVAIANGGTGETTRQAAIDALAGATTSGQYLRGNGTDVVMATIVAGDVPTLNQNTTGSSGSCTGNSATATTATTANALNTANNYQVNSLGVGTAGSGTAGEIRATNNITAFFSDDRLKTRHGKIENALEKLHTLDGFYYTPNQVAQDLGYAPIQDIGVSAQAVQAILPEVVAPAPIDDKYLTVRYEKLVPLLIEAIKELKAEVDSLKGK